MVGALLFEGALALVAVLLGWWVGVAPFDTVAWSWPSAAWSALATLPPLAMLWWLLRTEHPRLVGLREGTDRELGPWARAAGWPVLVGLAILAGVGEEALFRGVLQRALGDPLGAVGGWLVAGVAFGMVHWLSPLYASLATLAGLYLGACFVLTGNLLVPIVVHAAYDAVALLVLARRGKVGAEGGED